MSSLKNFNTDLSVLYKNILKSVSSEYEVVLYPKNPFIIENAHILVSSYMNMTLILHFKSKESANIKYLLYRINLLRLAYPIDSRVILYFDSSTHIQDAFLLESMNQLHVVDSIKDVIYLIKNKKDTRKLGGDEKYGLGKIKSENFYRSNLIYLKTYNNNINIEKAQPYDKLLSTYKKNESIKLNNKTIKKFSSFQKGALIAVEKLQENKNYRNSIKLLSFYSFLNNFKSDGDYLIFSKNKLPNCILIDKFPQVESIINFHNSLSFSNLYLSKLEQDSDDFYSTFYSFGQKYNERLEKFRKYNEIKN